MTKTTLSSALKTLIDLNLNMINMAKRVERASTKQASTSIQQFLKELPILLYD